MKHLITFLFCFSFFFSLYGQMWNGQDTLYGNEWINYEQPYFKIKIAEDGIYRLGYEQMLAAGIPLAEISGNQLQLFHLGKEQPIFVSREGALQSGDFLEFYGQKNRSELDRYLFQDPEGDLLNPEYSLVTDTAIYFLSWSVTATAPIRYQQIDNPLGNLPALQPWVWHTETTVFSDEYIKEYYRQSGVTIFYSHYGHAEGFGSRSINQLLAAGSTVQTVEINTPFAYNGGPAAILKTRFGAGPGAHDQHIRVNGQEVYQEKFSEMTVRAPTAGFQVAGNQTEVVFEGLADERDEASLAFVSITYPRQTDADNQPAFQFSTDVPNPQYLEFSRLKGDGQPVLYDLTTKQRLVGLDEDGKIKINLPAGQGKRNYILVRSEAGVQPVSSLEAVQFIDYGNVNAQFVLVTHPILRQKFEGQDLVQAYADYRASEAGGNYSSLVINVQQIYDQFGYGLNRHPQALRNMAHFFNHRWTDLQYLFLVGKGREYPELRKEEELQAAEGQSFFLPSFGYPASDNLLFSSNQSSVPVAAEGRLSATTPQELNIYLKKVKALEANKNNAQTIEERAWMKRVVHLGGGGTPGEQNSIQFNLNNLEKILNTNQFGGQVSSFFKKSTQVIETTFSAQIFNTINAGTSVITFFGHSSPGTFDFNIDNPDNYDNYGKYPLILSLGCYSGNTFTNFKGIGERFVFYEDKGAVAFGASRGVGYISALGRFSSKYYELLGGELYGKGIGDVLRATRQSLDNITSLDTKTLVEQFMLLGDPAIRLNPRPGPDYVVDVGSVSFEPKVLNSQLDSFDLSFDVVNLGQHLPDSMNLLISQELPDGTRKTFEKIRVATPSFSLQQHIRLPMLGKQAVGLNTFYIQVDADQEITELPQPSAEANNDLVRSNGSPGVTLYIVDNTARPIFPTNFALIGEKPVHLRASTSDALAPERTYIMEIDTSLQFDSPLKQRKLINQSGGIVDWETNISLIDSTVYYWRISPDSVNQEIGYAWETSSFTYVDGSPDGWRQGHYWQWLEGKMENIKINDQRQFQFVENFRSLRIRNKIYDPIFQPAGFVNGALWTDFFRFNIPEAFTVVVADTLGQFWLNFRPGEYGSVNTNAARIASYPFRANTPEQRAKIITFLEDVIPDGYYVLVYPALKDSIYNLNVSEWEADSLLQDGKNLFNVLEKQGAQNIRDLKQEMRPYVFSYRKNTLPISERLADSKADVLEFEVALPGLWTEGLYTTPIIGPASKWGKLSWTTSPLSSTDTVSLSLYGEDVNGQKVLLLDQWSGRDTTLDFVDIETFPFLQASVFLKDEREFSSVQLQSLQVTYEGLPDAALNPQKRFSFFRDTLVQGQQMSVQMAIGNPSNYDLDSLAVAYTISNASNEQTIYRQRLAPLPAGDTLMAVFGLETQEISGPQTLSISVNPGPEQAELYSFNNYAQIPFYVQRDQEGPVLDVSFDGMRIMEGDLVSARPEINITLTDENKYLLLTDTALFSISLRYPDGTSKKISFSDERLNYIPATEKLNRASIIYNPLFTESGTYALMVQGRDASGNRSGLLDYQVSFEVIIERMISNILAYPNPFSTATRFVYTLTGDQAPDEFQLQILTVSGKIVRQIGREEFGQMRIGTHQSDFVWDGTDEFGDRLANGVYLYRIKTRDTEGEAFKIYENGTGQFFDRGFGKVVILR